MLQNSPVVVSQVRMIHNVLPFAAEELMVPLGLGVVIVEELQRLFCQYVGPCPSLIGVEIVLCCCDVDIGNDVACSAWM